MGSITTQRLDELFAVAVREEIHSDLVEFSRNKSPKLNMKLADYWLPPRPHAPGRSKTMLYLLAKEFPGGNALEIGTYEGSSAACMAMGFGDGGVVTTVEIDQKTLKGVQGASPQKFQGLNIEFLEGNSHHENVKEMVDGWYDIVYIDGDHGFKGMQLDWKWYSPMSNLVVVDDTDNKDWPGVSEWLQRTDFAAWSQVNYHALNPSDGMSFFLRDDEG